VETVICMVVKLVVRVDVDVAGGGSLDVFFAIEEEAIGLVGALHN
jgi:hypothetical protein